MTRQESDDSRAWRERANTHLAYTSTGARVAFVSDDFHYVRVELPLVDVTRNLQGSIFGGSIYAAVDPIYEVMLITLLGSGYAVWTKAASIRFRRPAWSTLTAEFELDDDVLESVRAAVARDGRIDRTFHVDLVDEDGTVCAEVEKVVFVGARDTQENE